MSLESDTSKNHKFSAHIESPRSASSKANSYDSGIDVVRFFTVKRADVNDFKHIYLTMRKFVIGLL